MSHLDIRDAILTLEKSIKDVSNKLLRHEAREFQASELAKKVMQTLVIKQDQGERNMQAVARQLVSMEERILSIEALIQTNHFKPIAVTNPLFIATVAGFLSLTCSNDEDRTRLVRTEVPDDSIFPSRKV
ncbi:hypothetical protein Pcinc_014939 [Petrolisthes cinctipes]|uniref:Uncharacterized protein n=1 Tax=Petrolisthes cinctipes TaxID=88211 RepID=A0AAE1KNP5_PETCI|nr:hypothetical protein Pcinc_014939 [Petrolisthes cinctipes]